MTKDHDKVSTEGAVELSEDSLEQVSAGALGRENSIECTVKGMQTVPTTPAKDKW